MVSPAPLHLAPLTPTMAREAYVFTKTTCFHDLWDELIVGPGTQETGQQAVSQSAESPGSFAWNAIVSSGISDSHLNLYLLQEA